MKKKLELNLVEKYPDIFKHYGGDIRETCMGWGFSHGDGWYNLLDEMCQKLTDLTRGKGLYVVASQVKEKFGTLNFYYDIEFSDDYVFDNTSKKITDEISDIINDAESRSSKVCESCGKPGKIRGSGWIVTLCDDCSKKD